MTHFKMQQAVLRWVTGKDMVQYFRVQKSKKQKSFNGAKNFKAGIPENQKTDESSVITDESSTMEFPAISVAISDQNIYYYQVMCNM